MNLHLSETSDLMSAWICVQEEMRRDERRERDKKEIKGIRIGSNKNKEIMRTEK
jgi:hypothetical protein